MVIYDSINTFAWLNTLGLPIPLDGLLMYLKNGSFKKLNLVIVFHNIELEFLFLVHKSEKLFC